MTRESLQDRHSAIRNRRSRRRKWLIQGIVAGAIALAALVAGSDFGDVRSGEANKQLIGWGCAAVIMLAGSIASNRIPKALGEAATDHSSMLSAGGAARIVFSGIGYLIMAFSLLAVLRVSIERLLVGAGLAGVILGIAAQQALGNVFAGVVLVMARPFAIGDRLRIRSGALGGIFDATVVEMSLTYVTLTSRDGPLKLPNSALLAAGVCHVLPDADPLPPTGTSAPPKPAQEGVGDTAYFQHPLSSAPSAFQNAETTAFAGDLGMSGEGIGASAEGYGESGAADASAIDPSREGKPASSPAGDAAPGPAGGGDPTP